MFTTTRTSATSTSTASTSNDNDKSEYSFRTLSDTVSGEQTDDSNSTNLPSPSSGSESSGSDTSESATATQVSFPGTWYSQSETATLDRTDYTPASADESGYSKTTMSSSSNFSESTFSRTTATSFTHSQASKKHRKPKRFVPFGGDPPSNIPEGDGDDDDDDEDEDEEDDNDDETSINATVNQKIIEQEERRRDSPLNRLSPLHQLCSTTANPEDLVKNSAMVTSATACKQDALGRLPLHCLSFNAQLVETFAVGSQESDIHQDHSTNNNNPKASIASGSSYLLPPAQGHVIDFVNTVMEAYPASMVTPDVNGYIPFEEILADWVEEATNVRQGGKDREPPQGHQRIASFWTKSVKKLSKHLNSSRSLNGSSAHHSTPSVASSEHALQDSRDHRRLTSSSYFAFEMLSAVLDILDMKRGNQTSSSTGSAMERLHESTICDISAEIVRCVATIPRFLYVVLMLEDCHQREYALSTSLMQRVLTSKYSAGTWLTDMLQSPDKDTKKAAIDYLRLTQSSERRESEDDDDESQEALEDREEPAKSISALEGFVPSLLSLSASQIEDAATTKTVQQVLDQIMSRPFCITIVFCDAIFLTSLITGFRLAVNHLITGSSQREVSKYIYVANMGLFYFIIREVGKSVSLYTITRQARVYFFSFWNVTDILSTILCLISVISIRASFGADEETTHLSGLRNLLAVTTGFLWLRVLNFLKGINVQLATFVLAILQISKDVLWFVAIVFVLVISFAQMFFTILAPDTCTKEIENEACKESEYFLKTYLLMIFQEFDRDEFTTAFSVLLAVVYSFIVVLVMLNVLIAVASDSYEKCLVRSDRLFGRARVMMVAELVCFQNLLRRNSKERAESVGYMYKVWWSKDWRVSGWSRASILFFSLSLLVLVGWVIGELSSLRQQNDAVMMSLASTAVIVSLFFVILAFLSSEGRLQGSRAFTESEASNRGWFHLGMLRILGSSKDLSSGKPTDWKGRVVFLREEMRNIERRLQDDIQAIKANIGELKTKPSQEDEMNEKLSQVLQAIAELKCKTN